MSLATAAAYAVAAWTLDEASGTRVDAVGSNDLSDTGSTGSVTGKIGNAASFSAFANLLGGGDTADLSIGDTDWTYSFWFQLGRHDFDQTITQRWDGGGGNREFTIYYDVAASRLKMFVDGGSGVGGPVTANNAGALSDDTWYLCHVWHDSVNNLIGISVHGAASSTADTTGYSGGLYDSTSNFYIGGNGFEGYVDEAVYLKGYILNSTERDENYNSGAGVAFADWAGGGGAFDPATGFAYLDQTHQIRQRHVVVAY